MSITYIDRATQIVQGVLGKAPKIEQVIKAVDSFVATNPMGLPYPEGDLSEPEVRAEFFVENVKLFCARQIEYHANTVALAENQEAIDTSKEDYLGDFAPEKE